MDQHHCPTDAPSSWNLKKKEKEKEDIKRSIKISILFRKHWKNIFF